MEAGEAACGILHVELRARMRDVNFMGILLTAE
jgi:hypothetical protein